MTQIEWITSAERLVYWGDMDADGFAILDNLRATLAPRGILVESILMDDTSRARCAHLGVDRDKRGDLLKPSKSRLKNLTLTEEAAYAAVATGGETVIRRIEQERIPFEEAAAAMEILLG